MDMQKECMSLQLMEIEGLESAFQVQMCAEERAALEGARLVAESDADELQPELSGSCVVPDVQFEASTAVLHGKSWWLNVPVNCCNAASSDVLH
eukprot:175884-Pelagomonas_calceolata.AAC.1